MREIGEKDTLRLGEKIENAVNSLSLENCLDMPDFIIGEMMAKIFAAISEAQIKNLQWHGKGIDPGKEIKELLNE